MENKEQKKEYEAPKMEQIELKHSSCLLEDSCPGGSYCGDTE
jgi:hypothetical protein